LLGVIEHLAGDVDPRHVTVRRVSVEREAGSDTDLEDAGTWRYAQSSHDLVDAAREDASENVIVKAGEVGIEAATVR
jgi:hypothetical protein